MELGLEEICFTDHVDYDVYADDSFSIVYEDYFKSLETLQ
ncbi:phosphatase, partial [Clostridioides difficile]